MLMVFKRTIVSFLIILLSILPCFALEFDTSVDDEIRKNYNPSKLELENLPPVPSIKSATPAKPVTSIPNSAPIRVNNLSNLSQPVQKPAISNFDKTTAIRIKKGTVFKVKSYQTISDRSPVGTRVSFVSQNSVTQRYITVPQGTLFKGKVVKSHAPQMTGNGGLIIIEIDKVALKGNLVGVDAKVTKAKYKKIFLNNIKGERCYLKSIGKSLKPGTQFYKKMMKTTAKMSNGTFTLILAPFTALAGVVVYVANVAGSPVIALFSKGGHITIPAGSEFSIKLTEDVYLY